MHWRSRVNPRSTADCQLAEDWPDQLGALLKKEGKGLLNTVIDAGGGDIMGKTSPILTPGGRVVVFGM